MKTVIYLAYVMLRGNGFANLAGDGGRKRQWLGRLGNILLLSVLAVYMAGLMVVSSQALFLLLQPAGLQSLLLSTYLSMAVLLVFFFGVLYVISIFYHSSDIDRLLPLPIPAQAIIGAKLLVTAFYEYAFLAVVILPPLVVYGIMDQAAWYYYLFLVLVLLILPAIPLCLAACLIMLIMRLTPVARNKDRFSLVTGLLAMLIALAVVFSSQSMAALSQEDLIDLLQSGTADLSRLAVTIFPGTAQAIAVLAARSPADATVALVFLLLPALAVVFLTLLLARYIYFPGVMGLQSSQGRRRGLNSREQASFNRGRPVIWLLIKKDLQLLVRTPIFFMNNVLMNFLWPAFILVPILSGDQNLPQIRVWFQEMLASDAGMGRNMLLAAGFAAACFLSGTNGVAASAISREGRSFYFLKIIPVSYIRQLWAKILTGVLLSSAGLVLLLLLFQLVLRPPLRFLLLLVLILPGPVVLTNLLGIFFELLWPKLKWDNEQKAVKQNVNVLYGMLVAFLLAGIAVSVTILLAGTWLNALVSLLLFPWLLIALFGRLLHYWGPRRLNVIPG